MIFFNGLKPKNIVWIAFIINKNFYHFYIYL
nr:MAG TPA: hypothetical protein [Caudoviricetes sp.]